MKEEMTPDNIVLYMLRSIEVCLYVKMLSANVLQELRRIERIHSIQLARTRPVIKYLTVIPSNK